MIDDLRIHAGGEPRPNPAGGFVLYWIRATTLRASGNFALDFAIEQATALGKPLLVYFGLRATYRWANDRIHTYILESAADLATELERRGIQLAVRIQTNERSTELMEGEIVGLANRAALVVTDYFPTFFHPKTLAWLRAATKTPIIAVDSATLIPIRYHTKEHLTARSIRPVLEAALPHHLFKPKDAELRVHPVVDLPFEPDRIRDDPADIARWCARAPIDHSVPKSATIRGGTRAARAQLHHFVSKALPRYADDRGDPNVDATSRLSPHLHFGTIGIHEVLLAARAAGDPVNYAKFQDEILTWRELSHNLAAWNPAHRTYDAVPGWAKQELADHSTDPRPAIYSDLALERGETDSDLWNACQRSIVETGELHNYLRMLWGKSVLLWTETPERAFQILVHLNNKYCLDGRDPNSYAGILWCFGRFDRPFYRRPIFGTVRYMSLTAAAKKFDVKQYTLGV